MTPFDLQDLLDALAQQCPVGPSPLIEDATEIDVDGVPVAVQWREDTQSIELTVALPVVLDDADQTDIQLALFRALLERHWLQMGGDDGVGFGLMPSSNEVVGMVSLDGDTIPGPDAFLQALQEAASSVMDEWLDLCGQIRLQQIAAAERQRPTPQAPPTTAFPL